MVFMISKEKSDMELAMKLRREGIIITPGHPFEASQKKEINGLIAGGVFNLTKLDYIKYIRVRIFNSKLINEVKSKTINSLYKKLKLVI